MFFFTVFSGTACQKWEKICLAIFQEFNNFSAGKALEGLEGRRGPSDDSAARASEHELGEERAPVVRRELLGRAELRKAVHLRTGTPS